jgi:NADPH:quinone reductase-like Zn-dependent oxidoreductase
MHVIEHEKPSPADDEVLVNVKASTVTAQDYRIRGFMVPLFFVPLALITMGFPRPKKQIHGVEFSGVVVEVGKDVTEFKVGDEVMGSTGLGAYQEFITRKVTSLAHKPASLSFEEAAAIPWGGMTGLWFVRETAKVQPGQKVLVHGASSCCGTYFVQLAKHYGAEVTGVCSGANVEMVKSIGADHVIDYTKTDYSQSGERYDLVLDAAAKTSFGKAKKVLKENGLYLTTAPSLLTILQQQWTKIVGGKQARFTMAHFSKEDLELLEELAAEGTILPVIDRIYPMEETGAAYRYAEMGHKKGNVVIQIG